MTGRPADWIDTRQIGQATVTVISEGTAQWAPHFPATEADWRSVLPEADASGRIPIGLTTVLIQLGGAVVVVDPGFADPDVGGYVSAKVEAIRRSLGLAAALAALGVAPTAVTHVVMTHTDADHCYGVAIEQDGELVARFPRARHFIGRGDWPSTDTRRAPDPAAVARLAALARLGLLETVADERAIAPGITLLPTPGETPGHLAVRVESAGERFYAVGDLFHHDCEFEHLDWAPPGRDVTANRASRARLLAEALPSQATLVFTHAPFPPWGRAVATADGYRWQRG